jgi:hypothetical protein
MGTWEHVQLDSSVWGWAGTGAANSKPVSLLQYTVNAARQRLSFLTLAVAQPELYSYGQAAWPRIWGHRPAVQQPGQPPPPFVTAGLQRYEQGMHTAFAVIKEHQQQMQGFVPVAEVARPPAWLDLAHRPPPRPEPQARAAAAAARQAASQQQDVAPSLPSNQRQVLERLKTMPRGDDQQDLARRLARPLRVPCVGGARGTG